MQAEKYQPRLLEEKWYNYWQEHGYFQPSKQQDGQTFSIQLPPPNITGVLHMGHAFNQTIMDATVRYHRMKGEKVCWIPGFDHSGIATQIVVERALATRGLDKQQLGHEAFLKEVWHWKASSGNTMQAQMKKMGCSVDWSQAYFTMDESYSTAVTEAFVRLYEENLIYRGKRLVNWDPVLGTAISDLEVENVEEHGSMWWIKYPSVSDIHSYLTIATTRPETLLGDVMVAVHPQDPRYQHWIGKKVRLPLVDREIAVVADEYVDQEFGTGCVKVTPAHDFNDYDLGKRHQSVLIKVFDLQGKILKKAEVYTYGSNLLQSSFDIAEEFVGLSREQARAKIVRTLEAQNLLVKKETHILMIPRGDRTGTVIEPMLTDQWFVSMNKQGNGGLSLGEAAAKAVDLGSVTFIPENWVNTYRQWMSQLEDWCISRQLWWGHQIPAWYDAQGNIYVARNEKEARAKANGQAIIRDEDVLDTWFSSALVPFATLGWPQKTQMLAAFFPSSVLVTGHEIIFFWVARMIMMSMYFLQRIPFKQVYIHGIVRDHEGKKMSKSEGNVIDPVDIIEGVDLPTLLKKRTTGLRQPEKAKMIVQQTCQLFPKGIEAYGADALRYTMASYASLGRSINFDLKRCEGYRNFCNKIWNVSRFVMMHAHRVSSTQISWQETHFVDRWINSRLQRIIQSLTQAYDSYRIDLASQQLYEFIWNDYCDWYVELSKVILREGSSTAQLLTTYTLLITLETSLRLLHPLMPFISEELWQMLPLVVRERKVRSIMLAQWPKAQDSLIDEVCERKMIFFQEIVNSIRYLKVQMEMKMSDKPPLIVEGDEECLRDYVVYLPSMARVGEVKFVKKLPADINAPVGRVQGIRFLLPVCVDQEVQYQRLVKTLEKLNKAYEKLDKKLKQPGYREKAPITLVEKDEKTAQELRSQLEDIQEQLKQL